jgi:hypothetical protein
VSEFWAALLPLLNQEKASEIVNFRFLRPMRIISSKEGTVDSLVQRRNTLLIIAVNMKKMRKKTVNNLSSGR